MVELGPTIVDASMRTYASGSEAVKNLKGKGTLGASYQGISGNVDAGFGVCKELNSDHSVLYLDRQPPHVH